MWGTPRVSAFVLRPGHSVRVCLVPPVQLGLVRLAPEKLVFRMCEERGK